MRVAHVHRIRGIGGSERHLLTLLPALRTHGVEPVLVGLDDPGWDVEPFYEALEVPVLRLEGALGLRRVLSRLRPRVVHTHLVHADVFGALAALGSASRLVSTKHNDDPFRTGPFRFVERLLTRRVDRVIAITEALRRFTVDRVGLPAAKVEVVPYGLDELPAAWGSNPELDLPPDARVLLAVTRLVPQKGLDVAVAAFEIVRERHPNAALVVLGEGPERPRLRAAGVYLPGRVGDVAEWYRRAELLVHPVRWEGFGLALLEAMLAEKPVVATRVSSVPEIVLDGDTGMLVPPDDPRALAAAIQALLEDPHRARAYGRAGRARARSEFSVARMVERTLAVYAAATSPSDAR